MEVLKVTISYENLIKKSALKLDAMNPIVKKKALQLITNCCGRGVFILITQGFRSFEYQNQLYAQGRTTNGSIVTNAKGGQSYHNYGLAIDFVLLDKEGNKTSYDMKRDIDEDKKADWMEVVEEAKKLGFEWGGDWTGFKDYPHFQMTFGLSIAALQNGRKPPIQ